MPLTPTKPAAAPRGSRPSSQAPSCAAGRMAADDEAVRIDA